MWALRSVDGFDFAGGAEVLLLPATVGLDPVLAAIGKTHNMVHNVAGPLALPGTNGTRHLMLGGLGRFRGPSAAEVEAAHRGEAAPPRALTADKSAGIMLSHGAGWRYGPDWSPPSVVLSTRHPGCVDRRLRAGYGAGCEYDGSLSPCPVMALWSSLACHLLAICSPSACRLLIAPCFLPSGTTAASPSCSTRTARTYSTRAPTSPSSRCVAPAQHRSPSCLCLALLIWTTLTPTPRQERGGRFVMVASSTDARTWSPFQLLTLENYETDAGDVYFFAAQVMTI